MNSPNYFNEELRPLRVEKTAATSQRWVAGLAQLVRVERRTEC